MNFIDFDLWIINEEGFEPLKGEDSGLLLRCQWFPTYKKNFILNIKLSHKICVP